MARCRDANRTNAAFILFIYLPLIISFIKRINHGCFFSFARAFFQSFFLGLILLHLKASRMTQLCDIIVLSGIVSPQAFFFALFLRSFVNNCTQEYLVLFPSSPLTPSWPCVSPKLSAQVSIYFFGHDSQGGGGL